MCEIIIIIIIVRLGQTVNIQFLEYFCIFICTISCQIHPLLLLLFLHKNKYYFHQKYHPTKESGTTRYKDASDGTNNSQINCQCVVGICSF